MNRYRNNNRNNRTRGQGRSRGRRQRGGGRGRGRAKQRRAFNGSSRNSYYRQPTNRRNRCRDLVLSSNIPSLSRNNLSHSSGGITTLERFSRTQRVFSPLMVYLVVDKSGSMGTSDRKRVINCIQMLRGCLTKTDRLGLVTFASNAVQRTGLKMVEHIDFDRLEKNILENDEKDGPAVTALYDGIGLALENVKNFISDRKNKKKYGFSRVQFEVIALTDGMDNNSKNFTADTIQRLIQSPGVPNCHIYIIGCSRALYNAEVLNRVCQVKHAEYLHCSGTSKLMSVFKKIERGVLIRKQSIVVLSQRSLARERHGLGSPRTMNNQVCSLGISSSRCRTENVQLTDGGMVKNANLTRVEMAIIRSFEDLNEGMLGKK